MCVAMMACIVLNRLSAGVCDFKIFKCIYMLLSVNLFVDIGENIHSECKHLWDATIGGGFARRPWFERTVPIHYASANCQKSSDK
jgi:hypothetical protein